MEFAVLQAQVQNLTSQLNQSTRLLRQKETELEDMHVAVEKQSKAKECEALAQRQSLREDTLQRRSLGEAQLEAQRCAHFLSRELALSCQPVLPLYEKH